MAGGRHAAHITERTEIIIGAIIAVEPLDVTRLPPPLPEFLDRLLRREQGHTTQGGDEVDVARTRDMARVSDLRVRAGVSVEWRDVVHCGGLCVWHVSSRTVTPPTISL